MHWCPEESRGHKVSDESAVYLIVAGDIDETTQQSRGSKIIAVYVGSTGDLQQRWSEDTSNLISLERNDHKKVYKIGGMYNDRTCFTVASSEKIQSPGGDIARSVNS